MRDYVQMHLVVIAWGFTAILGMLIQIPVLEVVIWRTGLAAIGFAVVASVMRTKLKVARGPALRLAANGAILGAVALDYIMDGQTVFLIAWLLPHGSWEIPAILIGGQAGLLLGRALIGWGTRDGLRTRMRTIVPDLATLIGGVAVMLVWAGLVEAFLSQYHAPVVPYWVKIAFGVLQLAVLGAWLLLSGRKKANA